MPKYHVSVPEVHYQTVEVEAPTPEAAVRAVLDGEGDYLDDTLEYSHALDVTEMLVKFKEKLGAHEYILSRRIKSKIKSRIGAPRYR